MRQLVFFLSLASLGLMYCTQGQRQRDDTTKGTSSMELEFSIELEQTAVVVGEDILIKFRLTNRSDRSMTIPNPRLSADWPQLCLTNATSRQERISSRSTVSARQSSDFMVPLPEPILTLEPKQSIETSALMSQLAVLPSPGKYEIKALLK